MSIPSMGDPGSSWCDVCQRFHVATSGGCFRSVGRIEFAPNPDPLPPGAVPVSQLDASKVEQKLDRIIDLLERLAEEDE